MRSQGGALVAAGGAPMPAALPAARPAMGGSSAVRKNAEAATKDLPAARPAMGGSRGAGKSGPAAASRARRRRALAP